MRVHKKEVSNWRGRVLVMGAIVGTVALVGTRVWADDASDIEQFYPNNSYVTYDDTAESGDYPVITSIASQPGVYGGHTYTGWSILAEDSTGSLDLFASAFTLTNLPAGPIGTSYTATSKPAVGDEVNSAGQYAPFDQIPELSFSTIVASNNYISKVSGGNAVPTAPIFTVSTLAATAGNLLPNSGTIAGYYLEIQNAVVSNTNGLTAFPGYTNNTAVETMTLTDNSGSMTLFDWTTSYSGAAALQGTPIGGVVDLYGFVEGFGTTTEFVPLSIVAVPEPSSVALVGLGVAGLVAIRRRRRS